jgi:hypothetical protein
MCVCVCVWFHVCLNNFSIMVPYVFIIVLEIPFMFIPPLSEYFIPGCRLDLLITERLAPVSNKNVSLFSLPKSTLSCIVSRIDLIRLLHSWILNWGQHTVSWTGKSVGCSQTPTLVSQIGPTFILDSAINLCVAFHAIFSTHQTLSAILSNVTFKSTIKTTHNLSNLNKLIYLPCMGVRKFLIASTLMSHVA